MINKKIVAVIPVRAGSKRLPNKHLLPFGDTNLLVNKINQLKKVPEISRIVVSSDSEEMLDIARKNGAAAQYRPRDYADEKTKSFNEVVEYIASNLDGEILVWAFATAPLIGSELYSKTINKFLEVKEKGFDSLVTVTKLQKYIWNDSGPVNVDYSILPITPKNNLPNYFYVNDGIYIANREDMIKWKLYHGESPYPFEISKYASVDIDDIYDFAQAEAYLKLKER